MGITGLNILNYDSLGKVSTSITVMTVTSCSSRGACLGTREPVEELKRTGRGGRKRGVQGSKTLACRSQVIKDSALSGSEVDSVLLCYLRFSHLC